MCSNGESCPVGNTCCLGRGNTYMCCPMAHAVCCSDHKTCCASDTPVCDTAHGECLGVSYQKDGPFGEMVGKIESSPVVQLDQPLY